MVGLVPLFAAVTLEQPVVERLPGFRKRMDWFLKNRPDLANDITYCEHRGAGKGGWLLAIPSRQRLERVLRYLLDEDEFLSPFGVRAAVALPQEPPLHHPLAVRRIPRRLRAGRVDDGDVRRQLQLARPGVGWPVNYLLVEALQRYHYFFYGDRLRVECPTGSGRMMDLMEVATEIASRLVRLFLPDGQGRRPCHGDDRRFAADPHWRELVLFHEYFPRRHGPRLRRRPPDRLDRPGRAAAGEVRLQGPRALTA